MADYKTTKNTRIDQFNTATIDLEHYDPEEMIQLLNELPNPLAIIQDFTKYCIKNPSFYHSSHEIVSFYNKFVLCNYPTFSDFGEAIKTIELLSKLSDETHYLLINFDFYSDDFFNTILYNAIKENLLDIVCNIIYQSIKHGFFMNLSTLFTLAQNNHIQSKSIHLMVFQFSRYLTQFCSECVIASYNYLRSSQKEVQFYDLGKEAYKAFITIIRYLNSENNVDFETIVYDLKQTLIKFQDNMNVLASISEMLLEIHELSPETFDEETFISIPAELIKCSSKLLARNFDNEQSQTVTALCLHTSFIIGDVDDIKHCIEHIIYFFSDYSNYHTNLKLVLIEYLQAIAEDEHLSKYLNNLPTKDLIDDLIEFIDFANENIDSLAMLRLLIALGIPIDIEKFAEEKGIEEQKLRMILQTM